ncbi:MAG: hypothetical protein NT175_14175 [Bacteroidetes bacterium]|nr:hypothetical protein [Bacteroidota bacterium]
MVLEIIKRETDAYKRLIASAGYDELYKWEALKNFQETWNIEADDFKKMYDNSFRSKYSGNLWANPHWFPKAVMLRFIDHDKEKVRQMFRDLYNEDEGIDKRIERFVFHCDKILEEVLVYDKSMKHHFHDGQRIVSLYLAFHYPDKYAIYKFTEFKTFMEIVKVKDIPGTGEYERFFKVVRTLYNILIKDEELMKLHRAILKDDCYKGETLMLAQDFIFTTARRYL